MNCEVTKKYCFFQIHLSFFFWMSVAKEILRMIVIKKVKVCVEFSNVLPIYAKSLILYKEFITFTG